MKPSHENSGRTLDRLLRRYSSPSPEQMKSAIDRVRDSLRVAPRASGDSEQSIGDFQPPRHRFTVVAFALAGTAVLALAAGLAYLSFFQNRSEVRAVVELTTGSLSRVSGGQGALLAPGETIEAGDVVRTNDGTATVKLVDGSRLELRSKTEFSLERADDGIRIHLIKGSLLVTAAQRDAGHLYVQTRDVIVSVVGTVFLVNVEEEGSRVIVIEGEVRVQQGSAVKNLLPGQQLATNPRMDPLPVTEKASPSHVAILQQSVPPPVRPASPRLKFDAISIRPPEPGRGTSGFACRGVDGIQRTNVGETGNPGFISPQGRCVGYAVSLARLIAFAYGMPHRYGPETPDWSKPYMNPPGERPRQPTTFQISATTDNPATVTLGELRQMVQSMLADRFKLEFHVDTQEVPIYALVVSKGGMRIKETSGEEYLPAADFSTLTTAGGPTLRGRSTIPKLLQFVNGFINPLGFVTGDLASHVEDKTGLTGIYEYELVLPVPGGGSRGENPAPQGGADDAATRSFAWRAPAMSEALEQQLGFRLERQKMSTEVLIVDKVELPSEN